MGRGAIRKGAQWCRAAIEQVSVRIAAAPVLPLRPTVHLLCPPSLVLSEHTLPQAFCGSRSCCITEPSPSVASCMWLIPKAQA